MSVADAGFLFYVAGLVAAKGCFGIWRNPTIGNHACRFRLKLRSYDRDLAQMLVEATGVGEVVTENGSRSTAAVWLVTTKEDCTRLIAILSRYPILACKQSNRFAVWKEAVIFWNMMTTLGPTRFAGRKWKSLAQRLRSAGQIRTAKKELTRASRNPRKNRRHHSHI